MAYSLSSHFAGQGLLDRFDFFTGQDPSNGFVNYQSREKALASKLVSIDESNRVKLSVDSVNTYSTQDQGRPSVKLTSNEAFTHGLFIADFAHMPGSTCGTWPAFWAFNNEQDGASWPPGGELNIIEGANTARWNSFSGHSMSGCQASNQGETECPSDAETMSCNFLAPASDTTSYGDAFNAEGGGVYAMEWDSDDVKMWHFPRSAIPDDIQMAPMIRLDPSAWGPPQARFAGSECGAGAYFANMSLAINTNFCGAYAGNDWSLDSECRQLAPTCEEYVAANPGAFSNSFWEINYIDVYQKTPSSNNTGKISPPFPIPSGKNITMIPSGTRTVTVLAVTKAMTTAEPTQTSGRLDDPSTVDGWALLGCFDSPAGEQGFERMASSPMMNVETCVKSCAGRRYAAVSGETCYCADTLAHANAVANDMCSTPCSGDSNAVCGGMAKERASAPGLVSTGLFRGNSSTSNMTLAYPLQRPESSSNVRCTVYGMLEGITMPVAPIKEEYLEASASSSKEDLRITAVASASSPTETGIANPVQMVTGTGARPVQMAIGTGAAYPMQTAPGSYRAYMTAPVPVITDASILAMSSATRASLGFSLWVIVFGIGMMWW